MRPNLSGLAMRILYILNLFQLTILTLTFTHIQTFRVWRVLAKQILTKSVSISDQDRLQISASALYSNSGSCCCYAAHIFNLHQIICTHNIGLILNLTQIPNQGDRVISHTTYVSAWLGSPSYGIHHILVVAQFRYRQLRLPILYYYTHTHYLVSSNVTNFSSISMTAR